MKAKSKKKVNWGLSKRLETLKRLWELRVLRFTYTKNRDQKKTEKSWFPENYPQICQMQFVKVSFKELTAILQR